MNLYGCNLLDFTNCAVSNDAYEALRAAINEHEFTAEVGEAFRKYIKKKFNVKERKLKKLKAGYNWMTMERSLVATGCTIEQHYHVGVCHPLNPDDISEKIEFRFRISVSGFFIHTNLNGFFSGATKVFQEFECNAEVVDGQFMCLVQGSDKTGHVKINMHNPLDLSAPPMFHEDIMKKRNKILEAKHEENE